MFKLILLIKHSFNINGYLTEFFVIFSISLLIIYVITHVKVSQYDT